MSPINKIKLASDSYTAILAVATGIVIATVIYVTVKCFAFYGAVFTVVETSRF